MSDETLRIIEIGVAGIVVTMVTYLLGMFPVEQLGVVFSLTTLGGQSVVEFLERFGAAPIPSGTTDPPS